MARSPKPNAVTAFRDNIADAELLLSYARAFQNQRKNRMRQELREKIGIALKIPVKDRTIMDCMESDDLFVVFRDANVFGPAMFKDLRPLIRPVLVAACAAFETFLADRVMECIPGVLETEDLPKRFRAIPLTVGDWRNIEREFQRRQWGIRRVIESYIRESSSTAPNKVGETLSIVGIQNWATAVDARRKIPKGTTVQQLGELTARRNQIAHSADRKGQGRATLAIGEVEAWLIQIKDIVDALDQELAMHWPARIEKVIVKTK